MHKHHGRCPACKQVGALTRHHMLPVRFHGRGKHNEHILLICRPCHNELEERIPLKKKLSDWQYFAIVALFLKEKAYD